MLWQVAGEVGGGRGYGPGSSHAEQSLAEPQEASVVIAQPFLRVVSLSGLNVPLRVNTGPSRCSSHSSLYDPNGSCDPLEQLLSSLHHRSVSSQVGTPVPLLMRVCPSSNRSLPGTAMAPISGAPHAVLRSSKGWGRRLHGPMTFPQHIGHRDISESEELGELETHFPLPHSLPAIFLAAASTLPHFSGEICGMQCDTCHTLLSYSPMSALGARQKWIESSLLMTNQEKEVTTLENVSPSRKHYSSEDTACTSKETSGTVSAICVSLGLSLASSVLGGNQDCTGGEKGG